ncbi:hypothetical protein FW774_07705 [Pedobacter sp. BS3]|uniref:hypothetical protein n=1 Tax=Pedobacter sp. BS3 TaxID=2567937 RepID=UPI0011EC496F|nr:hypothetical protein [Pedobacter sp. BS3]TZF84853.1 hypothetical protein FW774_07705 [Pedobacter sp. BS3]
MKRGIVFIMVMYSALLSCKKNTREKAEEPGNPITTVEFTFTLSTKGDVSLPEHFSDTLTKVTGFLNKVYSSQEFKDSLYSHTYNDSAYSATRSTCFKREINEQLHRIDGRVVYENLLASAKINLNLLIQQTEGSTSTQGFSSACVYKITSNDYWIYANQPLAYRYARHIAHEFTHIRGYRHDSNVAQVYKWGHSPEEDPAYGVGNIVGNILERWNKMGLIKI